MRHHMNPEAAVAAGRIRAGQLLVVALVAFCCGGCQDVLVPFGDNPASGDGVASGTGSASTATTVESFRAVPGSYQLVGVECDYHSLHVDSDTVAFISMHGSMELTTTSMTTEAEFAYPDPYEADTWYIETIGPWTTNASIDASGRLRASGCTIDQNGGDDYDISISTDLGGGDIITLRYVLVSAG